MSLSQNGTLSIFIRNYHVRHCEKYLVRDMTKQSQEMNIPKLHFAMAGVKTVSRDHVPKRDALFFHVHLYYLIV